MTYPLFVFVMKYVYIKTPTPVMSAHKLLDNQPTTSFARFSNQATIDPMIPGRAAPSFVANLPNSCDKSFQFVLYPFSGSTFFITTIGRGTS